MPAQVYVVASGDSRLSANRVCWPAQQEVEAKVFKALADLGAKVVRAHQYDPDKQHGFIDSQKFGMEVFRGIPCDAPIVVIEAVWQYSHHVLAGLWSHQGPILTVANWSGQWPGLVGMLNLNGSLTKAGKEFSTLWSENFDDPFFNDGLKTWLAEGKLVHPMNHVRSYTFGGGEKETVGRRLGEELKRDKAIMGVFDEGCMGMFNAIIPDDLLHNAGVFKERLSQSALFAGMREVSRAEAQAIRSWLDQRGMKFNTGPNEETDLTDAQILEQCRMYVAAVRLADAFGCDCIGIQYQQGLKDLCPASDLVEGLLNNPDRPEVRSVDGSRVLFERRAVTHFNEVDECAGLDGLVTDRLWRALGMDPSNTLHDLRYGEEYDGEFVWVFEISGAAPASHFIDGYAGAVGERQPPMYFRLGGSTLKGISKPGEVVWSRVFVDDGKLRVDVGRASVRELPLEETERRWQATTSQWPIMHAVLHGVTRDQMMAAHQSNHIQVVYADSVEVADQAALAKAAMFEAMGLEVFLCGI